MDWGLQAWRSFVKHADILNFIKTYLSFVCIFELPIIEGDNSV